MAETPSTPSRGLLIGLGIIVAAAVLLLLSRSLFKEKVEVRVAQAAHADMMSTVSTNGKVEPVEDFQPHAATPGQVTHVFVKVGQHVNKGAELLKMDDTDARKNLASARASLLSSETGLANMRNGGSRDEMLAETADLNTARMQQQQAATALAATQALQAKGSASANEVASAQQRLADAQAKVTQLETRRTQRYSSSDLSAQGAQVAQAQAALSAARSQYAGVDIRAPFAGTVYSAPVSDYDYVQAGEALLNLADLNRIQVRAYFDEPEIGKLQAGQPVRIVWDAKPNQAWHGHIVRAPTTIITYGTRNVGECIISVDDAHGDLLPNTNVTVTVTTSQRFGVLTVPREALHTDGARNYVLLVVGDRLRRTPVQVNNLNLTRVEITSGLSNGDTVALNSLNNTDLKDGMRVKAAQ